MVTKKICLSIIVVLLLTNRVTPQSISATYTINDIPTSYNGYDPSCTGPNAVLSLTLPAGSYYEVTGIDISYDMTALGAGWMSHQRSLLYCQNTGMSEDTVAGVGDAIGIYAYTRTGIDIANGIFGGSTEFIFEMRAWRTVEGISGCNTSVNRVNAFTWTITLYYGSEIINPRVGINRINPQAMLDVNGEIRIGLGSSTPLSGMIQWNPQNQDFEGYNGTEWISLTKQFGWGKLHVSENYWGLASDGGVGDNFGNSVSISGEYAIVGAFLNDVGGNSDQGTAYIFMKDGVDWIEQATLIASDCAAADKFGYSVSISGDYVVVGAAEASANGKAYIFKRDGSNWNEEEIVIPSDGSGNDFFGYSVSLSGDYTVIGAYLHDIGANNNQGKAYVFKRDGTDWTEQDQLIASDGESLDGFGHSVAISGDYAVAGALGKDVGGNSNQGKAYVFKREGTIWTEQSGLISSQGDFGESFGSSVSISGDDILVGVPDGGALGNGQAIVFNRVGTIWTEQQILSASDHFGGEVFGISVSIEDETIIVADNLYFTDGNDDSGKAYIFTRSGNIWTEQAIISASDSGSFDNFGNGVSIFGNTVIIGAPGYDLASGTNRGKVYFFSRN